MVYEPNKLAEETSPSDKTGSTVIHIMEKMDTITCLETMRYLEELLAETIYQVLRVEFYSILGRSDSRIKDMSYICYELWRK